MIKWQSYVKCSRRAAHRRNLDCERCLLGSSRIDCALEPALVDVHGHVNWTDADLLGLARRRIGGHPGRAPAAYDFPARVVYGYSSLGRKAYFYAYPNADNSNGNLSGFLDYC